MRRLFSLFICFLLFWSGMAQDTIPSYKAFYNLDFRGPSRPHMWKMTAPDLSNVSDGFMIVGDVLNNRVISERSKYPLPLYFSLFQSVLLPRRPNKSLRVVLHSSPSGVDSISFIIKRLNGQEKVIAADTLSLTSSEIDISDPFAGSFDFQTADSETEIIQICYHAENKAPGKNPMVLFTGCDIYIDSTDISPLPVRQLETPNLRRVRHISLNPNTGKGLDKIDVLKKTRIVALGESMHYHLALHELQDEIHRYLIRKRRERLVLLERPLESTLAYNRYINDPTYQADTVSWDEMMLRTARMLRQENATRNDKVQCYGYDYEYHFLPGIQGSSALIIDFLLGLNAWGKSELLDRLANLLSLENVRGVSAFIDEYEAELSQVLWPGELAIIKHIMTLSESRSILEQERYLDRESVMAQNISFLVNQFSPDPDQAISIVGHWSHLGFSAPYPPTSHSSSAGSLLKQKFGDQYICIGMLVRGGMVVDRDNSNDERIVPVIVAPENSVEYQLSRGRPACFYVKQSTILDTLFYARRVGDTQINAGFEPMNLYWKVDGGLLFIDSEAVDEIAIPQHLRGHEVFSFDYMLQRFFLRRQEILSSRERIGYSIQN